MLVGEDFYFSDLKNDDRTIAYYHNTTGVWEASEAEELSVDDEGFWSIMEELEAQTRQMPLHPLLEYYGEDRVACDESNVKRGLNEIIMASPFRIAGL